MKLYHLVGAAEWREAQQSGKYHPASIDKEGFTHLSTSAQWLGAANRFYRGRHDLLLVEVDPDHVGGEIRFEAADGDRFPHLYGELELAACRVLCAVMPDDTGGFHAPLSESGAIDYDRLVQSSRTTSQAGSTRPR